jgi:hypothetical protein
LALINTRGGGGDTARLKTIPLAGKVGLDLLPAEKYLKMSKIKRGGKKKGKKEGKMKEKGVVVNE